MLKLNPSQRYTCLQTPGILQNVRVGGLQAAVREIQKTIFERAKIVQSRKNHADIRREVIAQRIGKRILYRPRNKDPDVNHIYTSNSGDAKI